jgi:hypothetical protein
MAEALKGWTKKISVKLITQSIVNHLTVEAETDATLDINKQPMPARQVDRKPEEQRSWVWWNFIVKNGPYLNTDDIVIISDIRYRIMKGNDWRESGFTKYEAIEDYEVST